MKAFTAALVLLASPMAFAHGHGHHDGCPAGQVMVWGSCLDASNPGPGYEFPETPLNPGYGPGYNDQNPNHFCPEGQVDVWAHCFVPNN